MKNYNPKKVSVIIGVSLITGFADGSMVSVERNSDMYTLAMGTDGEGTRAKSNDKSGVITITLMHSSPSNAVLSALAALDEAVDGGVVPALIRDANGLTLHAAKQIWVRKRPVSSYEREATDREWILETDDLEMFDGGNLVT